jgi:hypothetical protein
MALISPKNTNKDNALVVQQNATPTALQENSCTKSTHPRGNFIIASCTVAGNIAPYVGALTSLDQDALVETIDHMISSAEAEATAIFNVSFTAAAVDTLAEIKDKIIVIVATCAQDYEPRLQHSRKAAAWILNMSIRSLAAYTKAGIIKVRHEGGSIKILHSEILRFLKSDCRKPVASKKKLLQIGVKQPASAKLMAG